MNTDREKIIIRTSYVGIAVNILLAAFKAIVGLASHSIAVVLDAVNNLSDALSSVITIIGARLAGKKPDRKHPLGHGRIEYISAMLVSAIVLYAGITSLVESVKKIIRPEPAEYSKITLIILVAAVVVKIILGRYVKKKGEQVKSGSLIASGSDALFDAILSASVLASALIFLKFGLSLEAYVGVIIAIVIIKAGIEMMRDTVGDIIGRRADPELTQKIREILTRPEEVRGAYDLFVSDYGPERNYASVHLELPDTMTVAEVDRITRQVQAEVYQETGVILTGVGVYSFNTTNDESAAMRTRITELVCAHDWALQVHGFYLEPEQKRIRFDVVFSFDIAAAEGLRILHEELAREYPGFEIIIAPDADIAD